MITGIIERAFLYKVIFVRDVDNWEISYSYMMADGFEEVWSLAKELFDNENQCVLSIEFIPHEKVGETYGCYIRDNV